MDAELQTTEFTVYLPLEKASSDEEAYVLDGPLSSQRRDRQGDRMLYNSLAKGLAHFEEIGQPVDWNHFSVLKGEPKWRIGTGLKLYDGPGIDGKKTKRLTTQLAKGCEIADQVAAMRKAGIPLYYSVGGAITKRRGEDILGCRVNHVAVTDKPANPDALIGLPALAKSLGLMHRETGHVAGRRMLLSKSLLLKVMTAGSGPGLESTGGRALVGEDLEGAGKRRRRNDMREKRKQQRQRRKPRGRREQMEKTAQTIEDLKLLQDPEVSEKLEELKKSEDPNVGFLAGLLSSIKNGVGTLLKSKSHDDKDDDKDDDTDDDENEDNDEEDSYKSLVDAAALKELDEYNVPAVQAEVLRKSIVSDVIAAMRDERKAEKAARKSERESLLKAVDDRVKALSSLIEPMQKAITDTVAEHNEMLKGIDEALGSYGKSPREQAMLKGGGAKAKNGELATGRSRADIERIVERGVRRGQVDLATATGINLGLNRGEVDESLIKSIEDRLVDGEASLNR